MTGASGKVGHLLVELAAAHGARITALSASPERGARLLELGAEEVQARLEDVQDDFDLAFESVGGELLAAAVPPGRLRRHVSLARAGQSPTRPRSDFFALPGPGHLRRFAYWPHDEPDSVDLDALVRLMATVGCTPSSGWSPTGTRRRRRWSRCATAGSAAAWC